MWDYPRPHPLEPLPRHHAVLQGEYSEQQNIDSNSNRQRRNFAVVNSLRDSNIAGKPYRVDKSPKEKKVRGYSVDDCKNLLHFIFSMYAFERVTRCAIHHCKFLPCLPMPRSASSFR